VSSAAQELEKNGMYRFSHQELRMPKLNGRIPAYRLHRKSGQAIVTLNGRDHYLGPHGTEVSRAEYDRLVTEWLAHGRCTRQAANSPQAINVSHVIHGFWLHAQIHYRKLDGTPSGELHNIHDALKPLRRLYGHTPAAEFGPRALTALREHLISLGWCRSHLNRQVSRIKSVFRWAVENEMVPPSVHHGLSAVRGLQKGRTTAAESDPVRPVPEDHVRAIQPFVSKQVWAMIQLQLFSGARAGEIVTMRGVDLNTSSDIWTIEPVEHKTAHHGISKRIYFGPQAQSVLREFLKGRSVDAFLFSPKEAEEERRAMVQARRKTPLSDGNRPGTNRHMAPRRRPKDRYTVASYRRAIERGCDDAFPPPGDLARRRVEGIRGTRWESIAEWKARLGDEGWRELTAWRAAHRWHPHQLRHNAATHLRKQFGIEVARIILGHHSASVTEIYAEIDDEKARTIIRRIG
jgi:integrase